MNICARSGSLVALLLGSTLFASAGEVVVKGIAVQVGLFDPMNQRLTDVAVTAEPAVVEIPAGSTPGVVLERALIYADVEAIGLLFLLNPHLDPGSLREARQITIPRISGDAAVTGALEGGARFFLTVNPAGRKKLAETIAAVKTMLEEKRINLRLTAEAGDLFDRMESQVQIFGPPLRERSLFVPPDIVDIMTADLAAIAAELARVPATKNASLSKKQMEKLKKPVAELQGFEAYYGEERSPANPKETWPRASVVVNIRPKKAGTPVPNLRVYYQAPGLYGKVAPRQFATLAPPAVTEKLNEAQYLVWAGAPGDAAPLTDQIPITVRQANQPMTVDLLAK